MYDDDYNNSMHYGFIGHIDFSKAGKGSKRNRSKASKSGSKSSSIGGSAYHDSAWNDDYDVHYGADDAWYGGNDENWHGGNDAGEGKAGKARRLGRNEGRGKREIEPQQPTASPSYMPTTWPTYVPTEGVAAPAMVVPKPTDLVPARFETFEMDDGQSNSGSNNGGGYYSSMDYGFVHHFDYGTGKSGKRGKSGKSSSSSKSSK